MALALFTKDAFPSAAGRMHTESPGTGPAGYHASRPQCPFSGTASDTAALHWWAGWVSGPQRQNLCLLHFPKRL